MGHARAELDARRRPRPLRTLGAPTERTDARTLSASPADLDRLGLRPDDRRECERLLAAPPTPGVRAAVGVLARRLGTFPADAAGPENAAGPDTAGPVDTAGPDTAGPDTAGPEDAGSDDVATVWLTAMLHFTPTLVDWHARQGIDPGITAATLADMGRQLEIHRRVHGAFGLETWRWMTYHYAGGLFQLGRLQYLLHRHRNTATPRFGSPGRTAESGSRSGETAGPTGKTRSPAEASAGLSDGDWAVGLHISESGPLTGDAIDASLDAAHEFFAAHFPGAPITAAICTSWLLDPYLLRRLPASSNITRFASRFSGSDEPVDSPGDAVYFVFRRRDMPRPADLPRATTLQRIVAERLDDGGTWQVARAMMPWQSPTEVTHEYREITV